MNKEKIKQLTTILFAWGLGFTLSSVVGLEGIRETVQLQTLVIGGMMMLLATHFSLESLGFSMYSII